MIQTIFIAKNMKTADPYIPSTFEYTSETNEKFSTTNFCILVSSTRYGYVIWYRYPTYSNTVLPSTYTIKKKLFYLQCSNSLLGDLGRSKCTDPGR